nr:MAG TPA: Terminase large subunit [Crassvirales sp.]
MSSGYPFLDYIEEPNKETNYKKASELGYYDPYDNFLVGESGGFLLNINANAKFINTELLQEVGIYYDKHKVFTNYKVDSIPHRQFRKREQYRRKNGFDAPCLQLEDGTIKNIHITGSHYNFLNYVRIEQLDKRTITKGNTNTAKKYYARPLFIDSQWWVFNILEFAEKNGFHLLIDKTRRGGFSYMMAADSANAVNCESRKVVIHVAADKKYLTQTGGLTDFAVNDLKFYEENTPFVRGIFSSVKSDFRLGYKLANGVEADKSWRSSLISVSAANNPDCAIGKDAVKVKVEEVSTMDNFNEFMNVTEPAMRTGAYTTGMLCAWGTATSGNMQVFEQNFYDVKGFNFMPFENVWDKDSRNETCGFFKPYCWGLQGEIDGVAGVDKDGNSNIRVGLEIAKRERIKKKETVKKYSDYINYLGQYANFPSESFSSASENIFSSEELSAWEDRLRVDSDLHFYVDGMLELNDANKVVFKSNAKLASEGKKIYDYIIGVPRRGHEDPHGCIRRWFAPEYEEITTSDGKHIKQIPEGLYSINYDPVGVNKDKDEITNKHSHNSIMVWMNPHYLNGYKQKMVATYYGRPDTLEEADKICYYLAVYYNCIGTTNVEVNRGETVSNFRKWNALKFLSCEPLEVFDASFKGKVNTTYGYNISGEQHKLDCVRLTKEFLYEEIGKDEFGNPIRNFHRIYDYQTILELKKWSNKGNYDRVSSILLRGIEWKAMKLNAEDELNHRKDLDVTNLEENDILQRNWFTIIIPIMLISTYLINIM